MMKVTFVDGSQQTYEHNKVERLGNMEGIKRIEFPTHKVRFKIGVSRWLLEETLEPQLGLKIGLEEVGDKCFASCVYEGALTLAEVIHSAIERIFPYAESISYVNEIRTEFSY